MKTCEFCGNEITNVYGSGRFCSSICARGFSGFKSKGSSKKRKITEHFCKVCGKKLLKPRKHGACNICVRNLPEYKSKLSISLAGNGGYRQGSGIGKKCEYNSPIAGLVKLDSSFELQFAKKLDDLGFKWKRNTKRFYFNWNGTRTYYIPDFYLIEYNLYIETKGYWYKDKFEKTKKAVNDCKIPLKIIMQKDWNENVPIV